MKEDRLYDEIYDIVTDLICNDISKDEAIRQLLSLHGGFYCQSDIEGDGICNDQCDHCKSYYKPLEKEDNDNK